jgi:protein-tyrosine-phosphatase/DNA-binding transcriptional ArsR family regulator
MRELVGSDRLVSELTELLGTPQSLVSYHLGRLRDGGLARSRRSSADGRDAYYSLDLDACRRELLLAGSQLHPALGAEQTGGSMSRRRARRRVLFVCTGNSARSQMAQGFLDHHSRGAVEAYSAGSRPKPLHPAAVAEMGRRGIDISTHPSTSVDALARRRFDVVVTLCDRVREVCPEFVEHPFRAHWSIADPAAVEGARASRLAFEHVADELDSRVAFLLADLSGQTTMKGRNRV